MKRSKKSPLDLVAGVHRELGTKIRNGDIDSNSERFVIAERTLLAEHITDWQADLTNRGGTAKHADLSADRVRRLVAVLAGAKPDEVDGKRMNREQCQEAQEKMGRMITAARLSNLTGDKVQDGLATFRDSGRSLEACNHYRRAIRGLHSGHSRMAGCAGIPYFLSPVSTPKKFGATTGEPFRSRSSYG